MAGVTGEGIQGNIEPKGQETSSRSLQNEKLPTPSLLNCSNVRFTYFKAEDHKASMEEEEEKDEGEKECLAPSQKPSWSDDFPRGNIDKKKKKYEKESHKVVKEITRPEVKAGRQCLNKKLPKVPVYP